MKRPPHTWSVPGTVLRVIDGDTLTATLDLGWGVQYAKATIRLAAVNCPERSEQAGRDAAAFTTALLPAGTGIVVRSHSRDKYGRVLATVEFAGTDLATELLAAGHATAYRSPAG